jgi:hypothetical protein
VVPDCHFTWSLYGHGFPAKKPAFIRLAKPTRLSCPPLHIKCTSSPSTYHRVALVIPEVALKSVRSGTGKWQRWHFCMAVYKNRYTRLPAIFKAPLPLFINLFFLPLCPNNHRTGFFVIFDVLQIIYQIIFRDPFRYIP